MGQIHFIGAGTFGNAVAMELFRIYEGIREGLFYEEYDTSENHLQIHSCSETCDEELDLDREKGADQASPLQDTSFLKHVDPVVGEDLAQAKQLDNAGLRDWRK